MNHVIVLLAIAALLLTGCGQPAMSQAQTDFCAALASFQEALRGLSDMPADAKMVDLQALTNTADETWGQVMEAGKNYKDAQVDQIDEAYQTLSQTLRSIPDDATFAIASGPVTQATQSVQAAFAEYGTVMCPKDVAYSAQNPPRSSPPTSSVASRTISTSKGQFHIPGTAYMDGRDEEASPPLTLMSIRIWSSVARQQVACKLPHGGKVDLVDEQYYDSEGRYHFKIQSGSCLGWIPEPFLSPSFLEPIGDHIP